MKAVAKQPRIRIDGDQLSVHFDRFDAGPSYELFLRCKRLPEYRVITHDEDLTYTITAPARFAAMLGVELPTVEQSDLPFLGCLFEDQRVIAEMALNAKRFAYWGDCGLGKTLVGFEWSRQVVHRTGGRVLIVTLNDVIPQMLDEVKRFYGDSLQVVRLTSRAQMKRWCESGELDVRMADEPDALEVEDGDDTWTHGAADRDDSGGDTMRRKFDQIR